HDVQAQVVGGDGSRVVDVLHVELDRRLHDRGVDQVVHHAGGGVAGLDAGNTRLGDVDDGLATVGSGHLVAGDLEYGVDQAQFVRAQSHGETGDRFTVAKGHCGKLLLRVRSVTCALGSASGC